MEEASLKKKKSDYQKLLKELKLIAKEKEFFVYAEAFAEFARRMQYIAEKNKVAQDKLFDTSTLHKCEKKGYYTLVAQVFEKTAKKNKGTFVDYFILEVQESRILLTN